MIVRYLSALPLAICVAAILAGAALDSCDASAQDRPPTRAERDVARFLCGEADGHVADYAPLLWTMQRRATLYGLSLPAMVRSYSAPLRGNGGARGRWVRALPALPTPGYAATWRGALAAVRAFRRGELPDPCASPTLHFGSPRDVALRFPGVVPVDCGDVANRYLGGDTR